MAASDIAQAERSRRRAIALVVTLVVVVAGVASALILTSGARQAKPSAPPGAGSASPGASAAEPLGAQSDGGILLGRDLAPGGEAPAADEAVTVHIVTDFLCPWCGLLEQAHGQTLAQAAAAGEIRLVLQPVNALGSYNNQYSWRAMTAVETVAALEPERFWAFYEALWANQPAESDTAGDLTDEAIAQLALEAGVSQATVDRFAEPPVAAWAEWSSDAGRAWAGSTPSVFMSFAGSEPVKWAGWLLVGADADGQEVYQAGDFAAAIANVKAGEKPDAG
ncbi:MAG: thioredoxin domain-containing protein [Bifidobacteriaceae bacterium]|jgi:protein-disulfide isomerase|nr:thioredoxin domain-containing protein [Bifidobacteriaceae bacterium]